jgi:hypothetical protein
MELFDVDPDDFADRVSFNHYLANNYEVLSDRDLYVVCGLTEHTEAEFMELMREDHYEIVQDYGGVKKIGRDYGAEERAEFYLSYSEEENVVLFYTDMRKTEEIEGTIENFLENRQGVHYLYISPQLLQQIREDIVSEAPEAEITEFVAKRTERTDTDAVFRPEYARTINYYGDDGLETLREIEESYGVLPRIIEFNIPGGLQFRVNHEGVLKLVDGSLTQLFEFVQLAIEECLQVKRAYDTSDFQMVRTSEHLQVPTAEPVSINLQNGLQYHEVDSLKASMSDDNYVVVDSYAEEGSLFFSGKVIDQLKNSAFRIKANEDEIRVFPQDGKDLGSFFRFYEFVQDTVDEGANLEVAG